MINFPPSCPIDNSVFVQYVSDNGYKIVKINNLKHITCEGNMLLPHKQMIENYPLLFTEFCSLDGIKGTDCIINFANKYGLLKSPVVKQNILNGVITVTIETPPESIPHWAIEISIMNLYLKFWQERAIKPGKKINLDLSRLKEYKQFLEDNSEAPRVKSNLDAPLDTTFNVQQMINIKLKENPVTPCLLFDEHNNLKQYFRPSSLLSLMWFQFFRYVTGEQKIKQCPICEYWYDVSGGHNSIIWTKHCPDCGNRLYATKSIVKKKYNEYKITGMPINEIIKEILSHKRKDHDRIKEWILEWEADKNAK